MSFYEAASLIVWIVSSAAVVYSLYQVNRQTRIFTQQTDYVAKSLIESRSQNLNDQSHEITRIFVTYPELRPYFYYGKAIDEKNPEYHRAEAVAELVLDIYWSMAQQAKLQFEDGVEDLEGAVLLWEDFVGDSFAQSPILVQTLIKREDWYGEPLMKQMREGLARHASGPHAETHRH